MPQITSEDEGKKVVSRNGDTIGMVSGVSGGRIHVDPDPGITEKVKSGLGWTDVDDDHYTLNDSDIDTVTDDEVRLGR